MVLQTHLLSIRSRCRFEASPFDVIANPTNGPTVLNDLKYTFRSLARARGFTAVVILTLALGIEANTAIFSVVRGVMLKPLPHRDGDRLMYLRQSAQGPGRDNVLFSVPEINDF